MGLRMTRVEGTLTSVLQLLIHSVIKSSQLEISVFGKTSLSNS